MTAYNKYAYLLVVSAIQYTVANIVNSSRLRSIKLIACHAAGYVGISVCYGNEACQTLQSNNGRNVKEI